MKYDAFLNRVEELTGLEKETAVSLMEACLETFGERIDTTERNKLADQLPEHLGSIVRRRPVEQKWKYDLEEFYTRIAERSNIRYGTAVDHALSVFSVLQEAVSRGQIEKILARLPEEYREIFGKPPESPLSPTST